MSKLRRTQYNTRKVRVESQKTSQRINVGSRNAGVGVMNMVRSIRQIHNRGGI